MRDRLTSHTLRHWRSWAVWIATTLAVLAFIGFIALQVPGMGLDEEAHITHAEKLRQGHLASHDDKVSPELSSAVRCDRYRVFGSALNPGYPSGSRYECLSPQKLVESDGQFAAQQAQHTPVYYLPLALATKVVDKLTDLDPLVDTYRVAGLMFTVLSAASLLWLGARLRVAPSIAAAATLVIVGTSGFVSAHSFVTNDALAIPAGVALLLTSRRVLDGRSSAWLLMFVSFAVAVTKPTFLPGHLACVLYLSQRLEPGDLRLRDVAGRPDNDALVAYGRNTLKRLAPIGAVGAGLVTGLVAFQLWVGRVVPGTKELAGFYTSRVFQADYLKNVANTLQNPLADERPISFMDPSYGLVAMTALEAAALWGTVLVAFGLFRRAGREPARLARSALGAIVLGALVLFLQGALRGNALSSTNTRYLLPVVPFMFGAIAMTSDRVWDRYATRIPKVTLTVGVVVMLAVQAIAVDHTAEPRLNNAWTRRQTGVLASFINDEVAAANTGDAATSCIHTGDTVAVVPFMPALYAMAPGIEEPVDADAYWKTSLPRDRRKEPFAALTDSDVDVIIVSSPLLVGYERTAGARVAAQWTRCALWQPIGLGVAHPPFEVYVRPNEK